MWPIHQYCAVFTPICAPANMQLTDDCITQFISLHCNIDIKILKIVQSQMKIAMTWWIVRHFCVHLFIEQRKIQWNGFHNIVFLLANSVNANTIVTHANLLHARPMCCVYVCVCIGALDSTVVRRWSARNATNMANMYTGLADTEQTPPIWPIYRKNGRSNVYW